MNIRTHHANIHVQGVKTPHSVMAKVLDYKLEISEFELQSRFYVHFRINIFGKGINPLILLAIG